MIQVNWKAAATVVTGATALAGWLTSPSPSPSAAPVNARAAVAAQVQGPASRGAVATHATTIEEQSRRLAARLRPSDAFAQPQRDPFHFGARNLVPARAAATNGARSAAAVAVHSPAEAPPFPYRLSGVASDVADGQPVRTAVLSGGATGLVLAVAGDVVGGIYRVDRIDETAVELTDSRDGSVVRLTFAARP